MKYLIALLITFNAHALIIEVKDLCSDSNFFSTDLQINSVTNVGDITVDTFSKNNIPFAGTAAGMNSILNTPIGFDAYEIISDTRMRVYGWCYNVDGESPTELAEEFLIAPRSQKTITWFYGYAEVYKNDFLNYCGPVYENPTDFACH